MVRQTVLGAAVLSSAAIVALRLLLAPSQPHGFVGASGAASRSLHPGLDEPRPGLRAAAGGGEVMVGELHDPRTREARYGKNLAQYLVDLNDAKAVFDFCGGMMFQLVLTDKLRAHLLGVAEGAGGEQPVLFDARTNEMAAMPGYSQSAAADNAQVFHGREVRQVPNAAGGMNFVLQLSYAGEDGEDPEGWTKAEIGDYSGWGHDSTREWRNAEQLEAAGAPGYRSKFGGHAFGLHHRFFLHLDYTNQLWLSAEDGCEGRLFKA